MLAGPEFSCKTKWDGYEAMRPTRREFVRGGVAAAVTGFAARGFLSDLARAQSASGRSLVVLYLGGGNDALSFLVPYTDQAYYARRPTLAIPSDRVLQVGSDSSGRALGLHPELSGFKAMLDDGVLALLQRTGYPYSSRSHFRGLDVLSTASPLQPQGRGWLGHYLDRLPALVDPLMAWNTQGQLPRTLLANTVGVPSIPELETYAFSSPNSAFSLVEAEQSRETAGRLLVHGAADARNTHVSFVNATAQAAFDTLDRVGLVAAHTPTVNYPGTGLGSALHAVGSAIATGVGTQLYWVQTGGYDTHARQNTLTGSYAGLMRTLNSAVSAFYTDLKNQRLLDQTLVLVFSEFGRRVSENGSNGTDHGSGGLMLAFGGRVRGGIYGRTASLEQRPDNPDLEYGGRDVKFETDFRAVYARIIDHWLGVDSLQILGADFRHTGVEFI